MNKLIKKLVLGLLMVLISTTDIELYAYAYYNGFAFESSGLWSTEIIATKDGWEEVTGLRLVGSASFVEKLNYGLPYMENNTELVIPEYVEDNDGRRAYVGSIGRYVFKNSGYTIAYIPNHVSLIEEGAFIGCRSLKTVIFGKNLKHIGYSPFYRESLEDVYFLGCEPPTLADHFSRSTTIHVPEKALGTYMDNCYFGQRDLTIVGMSDAEISKIEAEMRSKDEYRHKRWVDYVLELKRELPRFECQLKNRGNSDVYEYIKTFRDPKIVQRENEFDSEITSYRNRFVHIVDDAIDDAQREIDAKGSYYQQFNSNKFLHFISTFADNISSSDIRKYFDIYVQSESNNVLTIQIHSTKNTKNLYEEFWKGLMPFISSSTYKVNTAYQSTYLSDALDNLSYKILSKIFNEVCFVESVGNPYRQYSRHRGNGYNQFSSTTYRFSIGQQNTQRTINILGSRIKASNLLSEIKEKLATVSPTSVSEQQQLKDCSDWCEERFWKCIYKSENRAVYPTSLIISEYTRTTQYGRTNEDKRESRRDNCRFDISQHDGFVNSTEFRKFCVANDIGFDDGVNIIFGCPVIQGGDKAQCLYIIKTDVKLIPNSTSLEIFVGDKKVR